MYGFVPRNMGSRFSVGVCGTQNVGKSTFIVDLLDRFRGTSQEFVQVGCDYRDRIQQLGLRINRDGDLESQRAIMDCLLQQAEELKSREKGNFVSDRTPIDALVYTLWLKENRPNLGITKDDIEAMRQQVLRSIDAYDAIVFLDLDRCGSVQVVDDQFRDTDLDYRFHIDCDFKRAFPRLDLTFGDGRLTKAVYGTREERIQRFVEKVMGQGRLDGFMKALVQQRRIDDGIQTA